MKRRDEGRHPQEKPSRTLFVRNINYDATEDEIREVFERYGAVQDVFSRISNRGMAFVTFSDIRHSENAMKNLQQTQIRGRTIDVHYSLPRDAEDKFLEQSKSTQNDTLFVTLRDSTASLSTQDLRSVFERFGDIKEIRDCPKSSGQKFVEFYDVRSCDDAFEQAANYSMKGGYLDIKYATTERRNNNNNSRNNSGDNYSNSNYNDSQDSYNSNYDNKYNNDYDNNNNSYDGNSSSEGSYESGPVRRRDYREHRSRDDEPYSRPGRNDNDRGNNNNNNNNNSGNMNRRPPPSPAVNGMINNLASLIRQQTGSGANPNIGSPAFAQPGLYPGLPGFGVAGSKDAPAGMPPGMPNIIPGLNFPVMPYNPLQLAEMLTQYLQNQQLAGLAQNQPISIPAMTNPNANNNASNIGVSQSDTLNYSPTSLLYQNSQNSNDNKRY